MGLAKGVHGWVNAWHNSARFTELVRNFDQELWMVSDDQSCVAESGLVHVMDMIWSEKGQDKLMGRLNELLASNELALDDESGSEDVPLLDAKKPSSARPSSR